MSAPASPKDATEAVSVLLNYAGWPWIGHKCLASGPSHSPSESFRAAAAKCRQMAAPNGSDGKWEGVTQRVHCDPCSTYCIPPSYATAPPSDFGQVITVKKAFSGVVPHLWKAAPRQICTASTPFVGGFFLKCHLRNLY